MKKNVASQVIGAEMVTAADGSAFTGAVTAYYTLDGGTQTIGSVGSGVCTHEGNGFHTYTPTAGETNGDHIAWTFIGTGAVPATLQVYPSFPQSADVSECQRTLFTLIESQRGGHSGEGEIIFWDAANVTGNASDANSGLTYNEPKLTYNFNGAGGVHSLLVNNGHQIIKGISGPVPGPVTVNEYVEIDTAYTFLRCDGRDWLFEATHLETCAVKSSAEGVEFSGFRVKSRATGNQDAICAAGDFTRIKSVQVDYSRGSGIVIDNASNCILDDFLVQDAAVNGVGHAVHIVGDTSLTTRNMIKSGRIFGNTNAATDGIRIDGAFCSHNFIVGSDPYGVLIHNNSGWGINEVAGANHTIIVGPRVHVSHNDLGTHSLTGVGSTIENYDQWARQDSDGDTLKTLSDQMLSIGDITGEIQNGVFVRVAVTGDAIQIIEGNIKTISIDLGVEWNLTGKLVYFVMKRINSNDAAVVNRLATITDAVNGIAEIDLLSTETTPKGCYEYQVELRNDPADDEPETAMEGTAEITENLRR